MIPISGRFALSAAAAVLSLAFSQPASAAGRMQEMEPNGTVPTANPLQMDANRLTKVSSARLSTGVGTNGGDVDYYSFTAAAGDRVYTATMTAGSVTGDNNSVLTLYAPDGETVIERDDDNGTFTQQSSSIAGAVIPASGTYYLKVECSNPGNTLQGYDLYVQLRGGTPVTETEPNDALETAVALGPWVQGSLTAGNSDYHQITLNAGDTVFLSLDLDPERDGGWVGRTGLASFGDFLEVALVVNDDGTGDAIPSQAMFMTVKESGTYYVPVSSPDATSGTYHLNISVLPAQVENYTTYTSADVPRVIPEGPGLTSSSLTVPGHPRIAKIRLRLDVTHALMQDLDISLRSPAGDVIGILTDVGSSTAGSNTRMDVIIDDDAALPPIYATLHRSIRKPEPAYSLGWLKGIDAGGTWTLDIRDDKAADGGTLNSWSLEIIEETPPVVGHAIFATDFESGDAGFTHSGTLDSWQRGIPASAPITTANSGVNCWKTNLSGTYAASSNQDLVSPAIDLSLHTGQELSLNWAQKYQIEGMNFDHAYVQIEEVGGAGAVRRVWEWRGPTMIDIVGNPEVTLQESAGWGNMREDISDFAGKTIRVRFHFDSDSSTQLAGWAVDDVSVTATAGPEIAVSGNTVDIADGSTAPTTADGTDFGSLAVASGSVTRTFSLTNFGNLPLNLTTIALGGAASVGDFSFVSLPAGTVPAGGSTTFQIRFDPSVAGDRIATVSLASNDADENPFTFTIKGTGSVTSPAIVTATMSVSGAYHRQGTVTYVVTLTNSSPFPQLNNPGDEFVFTLPPSLRLDGYSVPAGQLIGVTANYAASSVRLDGLIPGNSSVSVTMNAVFRPDVTATSISAQGTVFYDADGNGTNEASTVTNDPATPAALDPTTFNTIFQDIAVFTGVSTAPADERTGEEGFIVIPPVALGASATRTFTIKNVGGHRLANISAALSGEDSRGFTVTQPATGLNAGEQSTLTVTFAPVASGPRAALIEIFSDDVGETPFYILLSSEGANTNPAAVMWADASSQGALPIVTIGEVVTYRMNITVVPGITKNLSIYEHLPNGMAYVPGSAALVTTGFSGTVALNTVKNPLNGTTFADGDDVYLNFWNIISPVDQDLENNTFGLTFQARVLDVPTNVGFGGNPTTLDTRYQLSTGGSSTWQSVAVSVTVREPAMLFAQSISKEMGTAGDVLDVAWTLQRAAGSNRTAFDVTASTTLPAGFTYVPGSFTGGTVAVSGQTLTFTLAAYPTSSLPKTLGFQVATSAALPPGSTTPLTGTLTYNTLPDPGYGRSTTLALTDEFMVGDMQLSNASIAENLPAGAIIGQLSALDANPLAAYTFSLVSGTGDTDNARFTLTNGQLSLNGVADYETKNSYSLRVRANGGSGKVFDKVLTVSVIDVNEAPTISAVVDVTTAEDTATAALEFIIGDGDVGPASLVLSATSSNPSLVPVANIVFGGTGAFRTVKVSPAANAHGTATITVTVSDGTLTATDTFTVTVNSVNDLPTVIPPGIADILHTAPGQVAIVNMQDYFTDVETPAADLDYLTATAADPEVFSIIRIGNSLTITGTGYGTKELFITAIDPEHGSVMETVRVTVKSIPALANGGIPDTVVSPAAPDQTLALAGYFQDQDGDALSYAVQPGYDATKLTATVAGSTLTLHPLAPGSTPVTIRVTDTDGNFVDDTFIVTVENPIPVLTPTVGSPPVLNRQTGLYEIRVTATNHNQFNIPGFRIRVTSALPTGMKLHNSTAPIGSAETYLDALTMLTPGQSMVVVLEFFSPTRNYAGFDPTIIAEPLPGDITNEGTGAGIAVTRFVSLPDGSRLLEFTSVAGRWYQIEYSSDLTTWKKSLVPIQAGANRTQWYDRGAPATDTHPSTQSQRFYRVSEIPGH